MTEYPRIRPPKRFEGFIESLIDENVFETKHAVLTFAAAVGVRFCERKPLESTGEGIRWSIFEKNRDDAFINALALFSHGKVSVLDPDSEEFSAIGSVFEEYANAGLEYLEKYTQEISGDYLEMLLGLVQQVRSTQATTNAGLDGLDAAALELFGDLDI